MTPATSLLQIRRVLDVIRGRSYEEALSMMELMPYRACESIATALKSVSMLCRAGRASPGTLGFGAAGLEGAVVFGCVVAVLPAGTGAERAHCGRPVLVAPCLQAAANAKHLKNASKAKLVVSECYADGGPVMKRFRPRAQGR